MPNTTKRPTYQCSACSLAVVVIGDRVIRACRCDAQTPVAANMSATAHGTAALKG